MTTSPVDPLVRNRLGIDPGSLGTNVFPTAIEHRMTARHVGTPEAYVGLLSVEPDEWTALAAELVVPETWFFRGGRSLFDHLAGWLAERARSRGTAARVLSLPCSTGEEPFSLAIALAEASATPGTYRIDGIDIATAHLARAAAGRFTTFSFREPGPDPRPRHFRPTDDGRWELRAELREAVRFRAGNAIDPALLADEAPYDLILCRHLFIYLTPEARDRVMANLDRLLAADGLLCLSPAEVTRLPIDRFAPDGPPGFGLFGRVSESGPRAATPARRPAPRSLDGVHPPAAAGPPVIDVPPAADPLARARALADAGRLDDALAVCEQAARRRASADGFSLQGIIELARGRSEAAAAAFRKALYLDPDHPEALSHMIVLCDRRGESARAEGLRRRLARVEREESA